MEQEQNTSLFGLGIDQTSVNHLSEAARWGKFLAIVGFIVCGLIALVGIFAASVFSSISQYDDGFGSGSRIASGVGAFMTVIYIGIAVLYFFPCLFLYRFAIRMKTALGTNDQTVLNSSFQNLKIMLRYMGILTIIVLSIYALAFIFGIAMAASI